MPVATDPSPGPVADRLVDVTIELLERDGVLAGINLREIAERAGVNRANIYHHFGTRRELLRAAIQSRFVEGSKRWRGTVESLPFVQRKLSFLRMADSPGDTWLRALLVIDGDASVDPMPIFEQSISDLRRDVIEGDIDRGHDLVALQVAFSSMMRGYQLFRSAYAERSGVGAEELDGRVEAIVRHWLEAMATAPTPGGQP